MADNVTLNSGSGGATLAADDISGVQHQRVKVQYGEDGSATDVSDTNPMPVDDAGGSLTVDNGGTFAVQESRAHTEDFDTGAGTDTTAAFGIAVPASGGAAVVPGDATAGLKVNLGDDNDVTVTGSVTANAGTNLNTSALALESGGNLATLAGAVSGSEMQVDIVGPLPAGTNAIGKLAANSGVDIGDVDILSVTPGTGTNNLGKAEDAAHVSGHVGVMGLAVRTDTPANRSGTDGDYEPLQVSNGRLWTSATVTNTVETRSGGANIATETTVDAIKTAVETLDNAISGSEMQVDVVAPLPAGTNAIGKLAANSGVDIGDVDVTSIAAGSNLIGDVGISGARTSGGTTPYKNLDVDESEDEVKGTAGQVYWIHAINRAASVRYLKFYNATAASVTVGTTTPVLTFPIPTQGDTNGAGFNLAVPNGITFSTAITIAATTGVADSDTGAPGANEVVVNLGYA